MPTFGPSRDILLCPPNSAQGPDTLLATQVVTFDYHALLQDTQTHNPPNTNQQVYNFTAAEMAKIVAYFPWFADGSDFQDGPVSVGPPVPATILDIVPADDPINLIYSVIVDAHIEVSYAYDLEKWDGTLQNQFGGQYAVTYQNYSKVTISVGPIVWDLNNPGGPGGTWALQTSSQNLAILRADPTSGTSLEPNRSKRSFRSNDGYVSRLGGNYNRTQYSNLRLTSSRAYLTYKTYQRNCAYNRNRCRDDRSGCGSVTAGQCGTFKVFDAATSGYRPVGSWRITGPNGIEGDNQSPRGWRVSYNGACQITVCAPCKKGIGTLAYSVNYQDTVSSAVGNCFDLVLASDCGDGTLHGLSYDVNDDRRHARAFALGPAGTSNPIYVGIADDVLPLRFTDAKTNVTAQELCLRWDRQSTSNLLYLFTGGSLYNSGDEGKTFGMPISVMGGSHPALVIGRDGRKWCFSVTGESSTSRDISCVVLDAANAIETPAFVAISGGVDNDVISADETVTASGTWVMTLMYRSGGSVTLKSSTDGKTYS